MDLVQSMLRRNYRGRLMILGLMALVLGLAACSRSFDEQNAVHVLTIDGVINPVTARYVDRGIGAAEDSNAVAVVLRLDTPGGLVDSMRDMVRDINASRVPVITFVWPPGGRAASAGTFITMAGHVAAMAPNTNIGAASPVGGGGEDIESTLEKKVTEDLAAFARGTAEERGRNAEWAELAVREAVSATQREALELNVVDLIAEDLPDLLSRVEGRTVELSQGQVTLRLQDALIVENDLTLVERFLLILSDPNIAFILLSLGSIALFLEILNPGTFVPGIVGVVALILAFFALNTLPFNWAAVGLIVFGLILLVAELFVSGFGVLGLGGVVSFILGGLFLTSGGELEPSFEVSRWLIIGMAAVVAVFFLMVVNAILRSRRMPAVTGGQALVGKLAVVRSALDPSGVVFLEGERWKATAEEGPVPEGEKVTVVDVKGLTLTVRRTETEGSTAAEGSGSAEGVGETAPGSEKEGV